LQKAKKQKCRIKIIFLTIKIELSKRIWNKQVCGEIVTTMSGQRSFIAWCIPFASGDEMVKENVYLTSKSNFPPA
jgi:hypothetical protein